MKKAQSSTLDLMLGILLITVGDILVSSFGLPQSETPQVYADAQAAAEALFAPYPPDWNQSTVVVPGIVRNHRLQESLVLQAQNLSSLEQQLAIESHVYVNTTFGDIGMYPPENSSEIVRIVRYAAYNASITPIEVLVWNE
jgi:hypothetical protein